MRSIAVAVYRAADRVAGSAADRRRRRVDRARRHEYGPPALFNRKHGLCRTGFSARPAAAIRDLFVSLFFCDLPAGEGLSRRLDALAKANERRSSDRNAAVWGPNRQYRINPRDPAVRVGVEGGAGVTRRGGGFGNLPLCARPHEQHSNHDEMFHPLIVPERGGLGYGA